VNKTWRTRLPTAPMAQAVSFEKMNQYAARTADEFAEALASADAQAVPVEGVLLGPRQRRRRASAQAAAAPSSSGSKPCSCQ
jgi:hypothetical protein